MKLSAWEARALDRLAAALLPSPRPGVPGAGAIDLRPFWRELRHLPRAARLGVRAAIWLLTFGPLLLIGRFTTFGRLDPAAQERLLARVATHRIYLVRQLLQLLKTVVCFGYFRDPAVRRSFELDRQVVAPER
ncbi:MAG: hypothetical protein EXR72_24505 [Myxococcales bacterium]|nr:hypothetical protein [Myxococcales bacterium]